MKNKNSQSFGNAMKDFDRIRFLQEINKKLLKERQLQEQKIANLERKLHKIGYAEEQRDWLLDELTKKITMIGEIRSDLLKRERLSAIGELSARLAHDMRNPLAIIQNTIEIIKIRHTQEISDDVLKLFLIMEKAVYRIAFQLDEVLNFVRNAPLEIEKNSLNEIIKNSLCRILIPDSVRVSIPHDDITIECDSRKLESVFSNIIMNSVQAMNNHGNISIGFSESEHFVLIRIVDSGPGIPIKILDKIFEPLFTTKSRGTGLGLASVKNLIEQHGGIIRVHNNPTTFEIKLPKKSPILQKQLVN